MLAVFDLVSPAQQRYGIHAQLSYIPKTFISSTVMSHCSPGHCYVKFWSYMTEV
jgi:hypothetical protein